MTMAIKLFPDTYVDSVVQLRGMRAMREIDGVEWASAAMATPANVETLRVEGVEATQVVDAGANDFFLVVRASTDSIAADALAAGESAVNSSGSSPVEVGRPDTPGSLRDAVLAQPQSNVAVISVEPPGCANERAAPAAPSTAAPSASRRLPANDVHPVPDRLHRGQSPIHLAPETRSHPGPGCGPGEHPQRPPGITIGLSASSSSSRRRSGGSADHGLSVTPARRSSTSRSRRSADRTTARRRRLTLDPNGHRRAAHRRDRRRLPVPAREPGPASRPVRAGRRG